MLLPQLRFGLELEGRPNPSFSQVDHALRNSRLPGVRLPGSAAHPDNTWVTLVDGDGLELRSPKLRYEDMCEVFHVMNIAVRAGAGFGRGSGFHVHIENVTYDDPTRANILRHWWLWEPFMRKMVPRWRMETGWCDPMRRQFSTYNAIKEVDDEALFQRTSRRIFGRSPRHPTFECRLQPSTWDFRFVHTWTTLLVLLTETWAVTPLPEVAPIIPEGTVIPGVIENMLADRLPHDIASNVIDHIRETIDGCRHG